MNSRADELAQTNSPPFTADLATPDRLTGVALEPRDDANLALIIAKVGTAQEESSLTSSRLLVEDALCYLNRDPAILKQPEALLAGRGVALFRRTATESFGDYLDANYHYPGGWIGFVRETFLADPFEKRIISPLSPVFAGDPGTADTEGNSIHIGLRNPASANPRAFVTLSDKTEFDASVKGPSLTLRDPFNLDHGGTFVTAIGVEYRNWNVRRWSLPVTGATLSYVHGNFSCNLIASAGQVDVTTGNGQMTSRYGESVLLYSRYTF